MLVNMPPVQTVGKIETDQIPHLKVSVKYLIPSNAKSSSAIQVLKFSQVSKCHSA